MNKSIRLAALLFLTVCLPHSFKAESSPAAAFATGFVFGVGQGTFNKWMNSPCIGFRPSIAYLSAHGLRQKLTEGDVVLDYASARRRGHSFVIDYHTRKDMWAIYLGQGLGQALVEGFENDNGQRKFSIGLNLNLILGVLGLIF